MQQVYSKGTIKVVWLENQAEEIYSKMFDSEQEAEEFAKDKKDYLIFSLVKQENMRDFTWKLLPYGKHKTYKLLFKAHKSNLLKIPGLN